MDLLADQIVSLVIILVYCFVVFFMPIKIIDIVIKRSTERRALRSRSPSR